MSNSYPLINADDHGVWLLDERGNRFGISWSEIYAITGYKMDAITEANTVIYLDFSYGHFIELNEVFSGFNAVVKEITFRIPSLSQDWFDKIQKLEIGDPPIVLWQRDLPPNSSL